MRILGLMKTTLLDFPGKVAATVFTGGCNMCCPFCHNMNLVKGIDVEPIPEEEVLAFLKKRVGILDGVCITGGEPTLMSDLPIFLQSIKFLGYSVKLDTNGTDPDMLRSLIDKKLIDYVAMDIKSSLPEYGKVCGNPSLDLSAVTDSIALLKSDVIDYEFRTTFIDEYHTPEVIDDIAKMLSGAKKYYLQSFKDNDYVIDHSLHAPSKEKLLSYRQKLLRCIDIVEIRGVD